MVKSRPPVSIILSTLALSTAVLLAGPAISNAKEKEVIALQPKTSWTATMIEGGTPADGYCALARQYDQGLVLTLGQSARDEYSLAIDFQGQKLNTERPYKITLQPGPGEIRAYEMMPASSQAMVIRLGYDQSFFKSLEKSNLLKVGMDNNTYQFSANNMAQGRSKLEQCIAGLKGDTVTKTAGDFSAEKIENSEFTKAEDQKVESKKIELAEVKKPSPIPAPEKLSAEKKIMDTPAVDAIVTPEPIILPAPEPVTPKGIVEKAQTETEKVVKPKKAIEIARIDSQTVALKKEPIAVEVSKVETVAKPTAEEVKKEIVPAKPVIAEADVPKMEDKKLSHNTRVSVDPDKKQTISVRPKSMASQDKKYGSQNVVVTEAAPIQKTIPMSEVKPKQELKAIAEPKEKQVKLVDNKIVEDKASLKPLSPPPVKKEVQEKKTDSKSEKELNEIRKQVEELEKENRQLYQDVKKTRGEIDTAVAKTSNQALKKIIDYEKKLEAAQADNLALSKEIEELRRVQEDTQLSALSGDSAGQKSLQRYNEAKREIKRLGLLLEQQRLSHRQEKTELEDMLFDPAVTDQAQRQRLADLEKRLAEAEKRLQAEAKKVNKVDLGSQKKLQELEMQLAQAKQREQRLTAEEAKIKAEEAKIKEEAKKIAVAETKLAQVQAKEQALKVKEQKILEDAKKAEAAKAKLAALAQKEQALKAKEEKILYEAQKVAGAEAALAQARAKEQEIKAAEARMRLEAKKISEADVKLEQAKRKEQQVLAVEQSLRAKTQEVASAEAKMAEAQKKLVEVNKKQAEIAAAEKRLSEQSKKIAAYSRGSATPRAPAVAKVPEALNPSAKNIKSAPLTQPIAKAPPVPSFGKSNIQQLLSQSSLSSVSNVVQQTTGRYSWSVAGMTGKAEILSNGQSLSQFVQSYIAREKKSCRGDFASLPSTVPGGKQGYEIACIGANGGKSSSVVFAQKGRDLIAITHETTADNMDAAIDVRDKVASKL